MNMMIVFLVSITAGVGIVALALYRKNYVKFSAKVPFVNISLEAGDDK